MRESNEGYVTWKANGGISEEGVYGRAEGKVEEGSGGNSW